MVGARGVRHVFDTVDLAVGPEDLVFDAGAGQRLAAVRQDFHVLRADNVAQQLVFDAHLGNARQGFCGGVVLMDAQVAVDEHDRRGHQVENHAHAGVGGAHRVFGDLAPRTFAFDVLARAFQLRGAADDQPFRLGSLARHRQHRGEQDAAEEGQPLQVEQREIDGRDDQQPEDERERQRQHGFHPAPAQY